MQSESFTFYEVLPCELFQGKDYYTHFIDEETGSLFPRENSWGFIESEYLLNIFHGSHTIYTLSRISFNLHTNSITLFFPI